MSRERSAAAVMTLIQDYPAMKGERGIKDQFSSFFFFPLLLPVQFFMD